MPVQNLECQISTVLMKRFLDGDNLPQELLDDLEKHLKVCPSCREIVNNEKVSLEEILDGPQNPKRGVAAWMGKISGQPATASGFVTSHPGEALMHVAQTSVHTPAPGLAAFKNPKVLMLSLALAGVLIAMSTIMRDPTAILGPKAKPVPSAADAEKDKAEDDKSTKDEKDSHGEDAAGHGDEEAHGEGTTDSHGERPAADSHGEEAHGDESHGEEGHAGDAHSEGGATDPKGETKPDPQTGVPMMEDPRVPGKPTIDQTDLIIVGGEQKTKPAPKTETKPAPKAESGHGESHSTPKPAATPAKKPASPPKTAASRPTTRRSSSSTKRRTSTAAKPTSKPAAKPAAKPSSKPSGVRVYDSEGKPIN